MMIYRLMFASCTFGFLGLGLLSQTGLGSSPTEKGLAIVKAADAYHAGYRDYRAEGKMVLEDAKGGKSERKLGVKVREDATDGDDSIMIFSTPKDVKGTALLIDSHTTDEDDRFLYLPAVKRVKRIAAAQKSGPFLGSEFTYEDLTPRVIEKFDYKFIKAGKCGRRQCNLVESMDKDPKARYRRQILYISKKNHLTVQVDYYDRKNKLAKSLVATGYKKYQGKHWGVAKLTMTNNINGKKTTFHYSDYQYGNGFSKSDFSQSALKRIR